MTAPRDGRTLPWRVLDRAIKPYALAVSFATAIVSYSILSGQVIGQLLDQWPGHLIGTAGFSAVLLLWVGWWAQRDDWMAHGLLLTVGVWVAVWAIIMIDASWGSISGWLAFAWAIASGGAWLLEESDQERR